MGHPSKLERCVLHSSKRDSWSWGRRIWDGLVKVTKPEHPGGVKGTGRFSGFVAAGNKLLKMRENVENVPSKKEGHRAYQC